jgi:hypothetical protein
MSLTHIADDVLVGNGNPETIQAGNLGQLYLQSDTAQVFCNKIGTGQIGWQSLDNSIIQNAAVINGGIFNANLQTDVLNLTGVASVGTFTGNLYNIGTNLWVGKKTIISTSQTITGFTLNAVGMSIRNPITTLVSGNFATYKYIATNTWIRIG